MHTKRLIGLLLAALGIMGVIYTAAVFTAAGNHHHTVMRIVYILLGIMLFIGGIRLVTTDKEQA